MQFLANKIVVAIISLGLGSVFTLFIQRFLSKRGIFTYNVRHNRVGVSADDPIFGSVQVTWNNSPVANLYSSTIELRNDSLNDYENVVVRVFTHDCILLTERTDLLGTARILEWTENFKRTIDVPDGEQPTGEQQDFYNRKREYLIPVFNRGQVARLTFLNVATTENQPSLWLDILHKGVKVKFRVPPEKFIGVSRPLAVLVGTMLGCLIFGIIIAVVDTVWVAALIFFVYGLFVLVPGALMIRLWRWLRDVFGG